MKRRDPGNKVADLFAFSSPEPPGSLSRWRLGTRTHQLRGTGGFGDENDLFDVHLLIINLR